MSNNCSVESVAEQIQLITLISSAVGWPESSHGLHATRDHSHAYLLGSPPQLPPIIVLILSVCCPPALISIARSDGPIFGSEEGSQVLNL